MFDLNAAEPFLMLAVTKNKWLPFIKVRRLERDAWVRKAATALAVEKFDKAVADQSIALGEDEKSPLVQFLEFILEHKEEIIALIEMLMTLFAGDES